MHHAQAASAGRVRHCEREPILRTARILGVESGQHKILDRPVHAKVRSGSTGRSARYEPTSSTNASIYWGSPGTSGRRGGRSRGRRGQWRAGHCRTYRPWIAEPGLWFQFDWGLGPKCLVRAVEASARRCCSAHGWRGPAFAHRQREDDDHRLGHRDRGPSSSSRALGPGGNLFGSGGNQYCNGACPSPRPHRYLTLVSKTLATTGLVAAWFQPANVSARESCEKY